MTVRLVPLSKGMHAIVSEQDFERVAAFRWYASVESRGLRVYAIRRETVDGRRVKIRMHRFVMGLGTGFEDERVVNHINDDSLDNTRENLEICTQRENMERAEGWRKRRAEVPEL